MPLEPEDLPEVVELLRDALNDLFTLSVNGIALMNTLSLLMLEFLRGQEDDVLSLRLRQAIRDLQALQATYDTYRENPPGI